MEERFIVQTSTPNPNKRLFVKVYFDFLNCGLLNGKEQIIFIHLKQYINLENDSGMVYPTLDTLAKSVKMTEKTVRKIIQGLQRKGILEIIHQGLNKPNIYKINDYANMWKSKTANELKAAVEETEENRMIETLVAKGYIVKKKELESDTYHSTLTSTQALKHNHKHISDDITNQDKSQAAAPSPSERYTLDSLKKLYDYSTLIADYPHYQEHINTALNIIYDTLNTSKATIRIGTDNKPTMVVSSRLLKLDPSDLIYAIERFNQQSERIKNVKGYLLTILYSAKEQAHLDRTNLGHHNGDF